MSWPWGTSFWTCSWQLERRRKSCSGDILGIYWGYIGVIEGLYWGYIGDILGLYRGCIGDILGLYRRYIGDILGYSYIGVIYWDNGKYNGSYYNELLCFPFDGMSMEARQ